MVGNGDSPVSPIVGAFNKPFRCSNAIHLGHICVTMELETLFFLVVGSVKSFNFTDITRTDSYVVLIFIERSFAGYHNGIAAFKGKNPFRFLFLCNYFEDIGTCKVGEHNGYNNAFAVPCFPAFNREDIAPDYNSSALHINVAKFHRALFDGSSHNNFHIGNIYRKAGCVKAAVSERSRSFGRSRFRCGRRITSAGFGFRIGNGSGFALADFGNFGRSGKFNFNFCSEFLSDYVFHNCIAAVFKKHFRSAVGKFNFKNSVFKVNFAVA